MERDEYLFKLKKTKWKFNNVKDYRIYKWDNSYLVEYKGNKYIPFLYTMDIDINANAVDIAVLHDLTANSTVSALVKDVSNI